MKKLIASLLLTTPVLALAQTTAAGPAPLSNVSNFVKALGSLIKVALPVVMGLALLAFLWGLAKFIFSAGSEDAREEGKNIMKWGLVALFVMVSVWGLVSFIGTALGINPNTTSGPSAPVIQGL